MSDGTVKLEYCPSAENLADFFTKPLTVEQFEFFRSIIMYLWGSSPNDLWSAFQYGYSLLIRGISFTSTGSCEMSRLSLRSVWGFRGDRTLQSHYQVIGVLFFSIRFILDFLMRWVLPITVYIVFVSESSLFTIWLLIYFSIYYLTTAYISTRVLAMVYRSYEGVLEYDVYLYSIIFLYSLVRSAMVELVRCAMVELVFKSN